MTLRLALGTIEVVLDDRRAVFVPSSGVLAMVLSGGASLFDEWDRDLVESRVTELVGSYSPNSVVLLNLSVTDPPNPVADTFVVGQGGLTSLRLDGLAFALAPTPHEEPLILPNLNDGLFRINKDVLWIPPLLGALGALSDEPGRAVEWNDAIN